MRILKDFRLILALALALPANAAAQVRLVVPELPVSSFASPLVLPAAAVFTPALSLMPAALVPALLPAPAAPVLEPVQEAAGSPLVLRALRSVPAVGDAASGKDDENYAKFFDGIAVPAEGSPVYPRVVTGQGPTLRQPLHLNVVQNAVQRALSALRESVALGQWSGPNTTLDESCCGDAAPKLALLLRAQGVPARVVEAEFHYYVVLDLPDGLLVVDPTVRQFFGRKQAPKTVPQVFIGTVAELHALFKRHASSKTTSYDPQRIYFSEAVVREDAYLAFEAKVRAGGSAEHEPLRTFLGLLPSKPVPSSRLIIP